MPESELQKLRADLARKRIIDDLGAGGRYHLFRMTISPTEFDPFQWQIFLEAVGKKPAESKLTPAQDLLRRYNAPIRDAPPKWRRPWE